MCSKHDAIQLPLVASTFSDPLRMHNSISCLASPRVTSIPNFLIFVHLEVGLKLDLKLAKLPCEHIHIIVLVQQMMLCGVKACRQWSLSKLNLRSLSDV